MLAIKNEQLDQNAPLNNHTPTPANLQAQQTTTAAVASTTTTAAMDAPGEPETSAVNEPVPTNSVSAQIERLISDANLLDEAFVGDSGQNVWFRFMMLEISCNILTLLLNRIPKTAIPYRLFQADHQLVTTDPNETTAEFAAREFRLWVS